MTKTSITIVAVVVGLLIVAMTNSLMPSKIEGHTKDVAKDAKQAEAKHDHGKEEAKFELPKPMGAKTAPVKVKVYVTSGNECDTTTLTAMQDIGKKYGDKVYIEFGDMAQGDVLTEAQKAKIGCKSGITINGKSKFVLPERGLDGSILLDGPVGQINYNMDDVDEIIAHLLKKSGDLPASLSKTKPKQAATAD